MGKLADKLEAKHANKGGRSRHRVNFLAHKADIADALRQGWPVRQIWEQMREDGMIAMSYSSFCVHVRKEFPEQYGRSGAVEPRKQPAIPPEVDSKPQEKSAQKQATPRAGQVKSASRPTSDVAFEDLPEKERLELLKQEAFASAGPKKPVGPLIVKPLSREEERRKLFGDNA